MASIRKLKKDIQFLTAEGINDCIKLISIEESDKDAGILAIMNEIVANHNNIIERVNHPDGKDNAKLVREFYKKLKADYIQGLDQAYKKLEEMIKK